MPSVYMFGPWGWRLSIYHYGPRIRHTLGTNWDLSHVMINEPQWGQVTLASPPLASLMRPSRWGTFSERRTLVSRAEHEHRYGPKECLGFPWGISSLPLSSDITFLSNTLDKVLCHGSSEDGKFVSPGAGCRIKSQKSILFNHQECFQTLLCVWWSVSYVLSTYNFLPKVVHIIVLLKVNVFQATSWVS